MRADSKKNFDFRNYERHAALWKLGTWSWIAFLAQFFVSEVKKG